MSTNSQMTAHSQGASAEHKRVLLTGGRAPATLDLARQLAANGHAVFMAESCPAHLCRRSRSIIRSYSVPAPSQEPDAYIQALKEIIQSEQIEWLIPTCEELYYVARGLNDLSEHCHVFIDPLKKLQRLHSKWDFIQQVRLYGFEAPATQLLTTEEEAKRVLSAPGKWVFKPVFSRFSAKVFIVDTESTERNERHMQHEETSNKLLDQLKPLSEEHPWVAQQFIEGTPYCSYSIAKQGQLTAHTVYPVRFTAGLGACISFEAVQHPGIDRWVQRFIELEQFTGQIAFDFIVSASGQVFPIECNPRATSGIHLFRSEDRIDQAFFQEKPMQIIRPKPASKAIISLAMLTYGLCSIRSWSKLKHWFRLFIGGPDVVFRLRDPKPFFQQFPLLWWHLKVSRQRRITMLEASTHDIEWNGREEQ